MITFAALTTADLPTLHAWLSRPHVAEWWGAPPSFEEVERDYGGGIASGNVWPHLAYLDKEPIGFIQVYRVIGDPDWWRDETDAGARGIDQFLAEESQLGRGLGTRMIVEFCARVLADPVVTKVQTDPDPKNARAIRAYEKAGFRRVSEVVTPDGPALLMVVRRGELAY